MATLKMCVGFAFELTSEEADKLSERLTTCTFGKIDIVDKRAFLGAERVYSIDILKIQNAVDFIATLEIEKLSWRELPAHFDEAKRTLVMINF